MEKFLKQWGFNFEDNRMSKEEIDRTIAIEKARAFAERLKKTNESINNCDKIIANVELAIKNNGIQSKGIPFPHYYDQGWFVDGYDLSKIIDMVEVYEFILSKVEKTKEENLTKLQEQVTGCQI